MCCIVPSTYKYGESLITLIHKKGKDHQQCGGYSAISLGNVDGKILAKILSNRLDKILLTIIIIQNQVGFIGGQSCADNLRRLLHILWGNREAIRLHSLISPCSEVL